MQHHEKAAVARAERRRGARQKVNETSTKPSDTRVMKPLRLPVTCRMPLNRLMEMMPGRASFDLSSARVSRHTYRSCGASVWYNSRDFSVRAGPA